MLPAVQLAQALEVLERTSMESVCKRAGVADRTYRDWRDGSRRTCQFDTADMVLIRLGLLWWEVWHEGNTDPEQLRTVEYAFTGEHPDLGEQLELAA